MNVVSVVRATHLFADNVLTVGDDSEHADAEMLFNVLCGADGVVEFPKVKKPGADAGFFKVVINLR